MFLVARPLRPRRPPASRPARPIPVRGAIAAHALTLLAAVAVGAPAYGQACGRCAPDMSIHIGPFSFPNPFFRPPPPSEGGWRGQDRRWPEEPRRHSAWDVHEAGGMATAGRGRPHVRVRADLRRQFLSVALFGRERGDAGGRVPGPLSQRRGRALYHAVRRHDRRGARRRPGRVTRRCRTPSSSSRPTTRPAPAGARTRAGRRRSPQRRGDLATTRTTSS